MLDDPETAMLAANIGGGLPILWLFAIQQRGLQWKKCEP